MTLPERLVACERMNLPPIVVGNGPSLLGRGLGPEIDRCPLVVRCNFWEDAGDGYAADYGTVCHLHVMGGGRSRPHPGAEHWYVRRGDTLPRHGYRAMATFPTTPDKVRPKASCGLMAVHQLTLWAQVVRVGGFDHASGGYLYYWNPGGKPHETGDAHDWPFEAELFKSWIRHGRVVRL